MSITSDILELCKVSLGLGGLLALFCYVLGSVINILYYKVIMKG